MSLGLSTAERAARVRVDLRIGAVVGILSGRRGVLAGAAETLADARLADLRALTGGALDLAVTTRRAETLKARAYDGDIARLALPADATAARLRDIADPSSDLQSPMKGPFRSRRDTPADLHRAAIRLAKQAHLLPAAVVAEVGDRAVVEALCAAHGLSSIDADALMEAEVDALEYLPVSRARVPIRAAAATRVHVFRPRDGGEEHYAIEIGNPRRDEPVLARLHSACFTGDVLGSLKCDCGPQLRTALARMGEEGEGVLLYLNQEGRGIGLANKMRAYSLQDQGFDTVDANHRLGFEDDERDFRVGATILKKLGFSAVRLLTNNPRKVGMMEASGVDVTERAPLAVGSTPENIEYLRTKARKSGHLL